MTASTTVTLNPSPKSRFQESGNNLSEHRKLIETPAFRRACDMAMLQYTIQVNGQTLDGNSAAASAFRLLGAQEFLNTLILLAENVIPPAPKAPVGKLTETGN